MSCMKSKIIESIRTGADCECCWTYDSWLYNLECWHQTDDAEIWEDKKEWDIVRCAECSWDYE